MKMYDNDDAHFIVMQMSLWCASRQHPPNWSTACFLVSDDDDAYDDGGDGDGDDDNGDGGGDGDDDDDDDDDDHDDGHDDFFIIYENINEPEAISSPSWEAIDQCVTWWATAFIEPESSEEMQSRNTEIQVRNTLWWAAAFIERNALWFEQGWEIQRE